MIFQMQENQERDERIYTLRISLSDFVLGTAYEFDRRLIAECEASDKISDKLLALETIVRRAEEHKSNDIPEQP